MRHTKRIGGLILGAAALAASAAGTCAAQDASTNYRPASGDPFVRSAPVARKKRPTVADKKAAAGPTVVAPPSIKTRIEAFKEQRARAMSEQQAAPKPTTALLLGEVQITGIFRTPRGWAAMVEATPIKLSYVVHPGEKFYDGQLVAIEEGRLVFRRERRWTDGRRDVNVEMKPLRRFEPVDQLAAAADKIKESPAARAKDAAEQPKPEAAKPAPEKGN